MVGKQTASTRNMGDGAFSWYAFGNLLMSLMATTLSECEVPLEPPKMDQSVNKPPQPPCNMDLRQWLLCVWLPLKTNPHPQPRHIPEHLLSMPVLVRWLSFNSLTNSSTNMEVHRLPFQEELCFLKGVCGHSCLSCFEFGALSFRLWSVCCLHVVAVLQAATNA